MTRWLTIEELAQVAFGTQPVVMVNEVHDGMRRCIRTRRVGVRLVRAAHELGVRDLAMEALPAPVPGAPESWIELPPVEGGYFVQPDMRELARTALGRGWRFVVIRGADAAGSPGVSRSTPDDGVHEQARTRAGAEPGRAGEPVPMLLVWCGNGHATRQVVADWVPMGHQFVQITGETAVRDRPDRHDQLERPARVPARRRGRVARTRARTVRRHGRGEARRRPRAVAPSRRGRLRAVRGQPTGGVASSWWAGGRCAIARRGAWSAWEEETRWPTSPRRSCSTSREMPTQWYNIVPDLPTPAAAAAAPGHPAAGRPRRPGAAVPDGPDPAGGLDRAVRRHPRRGARRLPAVAAVAAVPGAPAGEGARHAGAHLLQVRGRLARPARTSRTPRCRRRTTTPRPASGS